MADPLSASAIVTLAFLNQLRQTEAGKQWIEGIFTALGEKTLELGLDKINTLRKAIWDRLRGNPKAKEAMEGAERSDLEALKEIANLLQAAIDQDETFATMIRGMAQDIEVEPLETGKQVQHQTVQSGGVGYQVQTGANNKNFFGGTHLHDKDS